MRKFNILLLFIVSVLTSCGNAKKNMEKEVLPLFTYEQTACFGQCPVFKLTVYTSGLVDYEGIAFVEKEGKFSKQLSEATVDSITTLFLDANFFDFEDEYTSPIMDFPTYYIGFTYDGKSKIVKDYVSGPASLKALRTPFIAMVNEEEGWF